MGGRPFQAHSLADLEAMARMAWGEARRLQLLAGELRHRGSARAGDLQVRIAARLRDLTPPPVPEDEDLVSLLLEVETLKARLEIARKEIEVLKFLAEGLKKELGRTQAPADPYARVFAQSDIPDFALRALRAAFRKEHHPDSRPEPERAAARERFLEYEALFDTIEQLRARAAA